MANEWNGTNIQEALLECEVVWEDVGTKQFYYLKLGAKLIPLGLDLHFADCFQFALRRNAQVFESRD